MVNYTIIDSGIGIACFGELACLVGITSNLSCRLFCRFFSYGERKGRENVVLLLFASPLAVVQTIVRIGAQLCKSRAYDLLSLWEHQSGGRLHWFESIYAETDIYRLKI